MLSGNCLDDQAAKWLSRIVLFGPRRIVLDNNSIGPEGLGYFLKNIAEKANNGVSVSGGAAFLRDDFLLSLKNNSLAHPVACVFSEFCRRMPPPVGMMPGDHHHHLHRAAGGGHHSRGQHQHHVVESERWALHLDDNEYMTHGDVVRMLESVLQFPGRLRKLGLTGIIGPQRGDCLAAIADAAQNGGTVVDLGAPFVRPAGRGETARTVGVDLG